MRTFKNQLTHARLGVKLRKWFYVFVSYLPAALQPGRIKGNTKRALIVATSLSLVGVILLSSILSGQQVSAQTKTLGGNDLLNGTAEYGEIAVGQNNSQLSLQQGSAGQWDTQTNTGLQHIPNFVRGTTSMAYGPNNKLYYLTSFAGTCYFRSYDIELKRWDTSLASPLTGCGSGNQIVSNRADSIYYFAGGSTGQFERYDIAANTWSSLAELPSQVGDVSSAVFVENGANDYVFISRGAQSSSWWRYDVATNDWVSRSAFPTSSNVQQGISTSWDGSDTIYAVTNYNGEFKKYSIIANTWTNIGTSPDIGCVRQNMEYVSGSLISMRTNLCNTADRPFTKNYNIAANSWSDLPPPPTGSQEYDWPPPMAYDGSRYIYTQLGTEQNQYLYRYDTVSQTWNGTSLLNSNGLADWHYAPIYDGNQSVYYVGGSGSTSTDRLYKYDLATKQVTQISSQINTTNGFRGVYYNGSLYLLPRENNTDFVRYDIASNTWTQLAAAPFASTWGSEIVDGGNGYLYATFGARANFYRYNVAGNSWQALTSVPVGVSAGGAMTKVGNDLYVLAGGSTSYFYKFSITNGTWTGINTIPNGGVSHGGFLAGDGTRYLYVGAGPRAADGNRRMYRFDTTNNTWLRVADTPANVTVNAAAFYDATSNKLYVSQGWNTPALWNWTPSSANYVTAGTWYSKPMNLNQVQTWNSLQATITGTGTTTIYTRTSETGRLWTNWQQVSGTAIASPVNKYVQVKIELSGTGTDTPRVSNIQIDYGQETSAPTLPSQFTAKTAPNGATLTSGQTSESQHPYFSWSGSSDGTNGSGVAGYYVYFGLDSGADPAVDGSFQTGTNYTVTTPMTAGDIYYVRIKVKDKLGNVSAAATFFSYRYFYISPPGSVIKTSDADFGEGTNTGVAISDGSMKLRQQAAGAWSLGAGDPMPTRGVGVASTIVDKDTMYVLRGSSTPTFWKYDLVSRSWQNLLDAPGPVSNGSSLTWDGNNYLYALRGGSTTDFYRYDIQNNQWQTLPSLPAQAQHGSGITYVGNNQIAVFFTGAREFYMYDTASSAFSIRQSYPFTATYAGTGIWFDGNGSVYAYLASDVWWASSSNNRTILVKYSLQDDTWRALANPSMSAAYVQNNLVGDGQGGLYITSSNVVSDMGKQQMMQRYDIASDTWADVSGFDGQMYYGSATSDDYRYVYLFPSANGQSPKIIRYDTWDKVFTPQTKTIDKWQRLPWDSPVNAWLWEGGNATTTAYDGSQYVYALGRDEGLWSQFVRVDPQTGDTKYLSIPPAVGVSGSLSFINGNLYYLRGGNTQVLYAYDMATDTWSRATDMPVAVYRPGASALVSVGSTAYALAGNSRNWYSYTPNGSGGTWTKQADTPANVLNGSAVHDGGDYVYVLAANNTTSFYRYSISNNSWTTMAALPAATTYGNAMVLDSGKIYAGLGNASKTTYVYDIGSNSWTTGEDAPDEFRYGASWIKVDNKKAIAFPGDNTPDYWEFNFPASNQAYDGLATHISQPIVTQGLFDYAGISAEVSIPDNTKVEFWTRTSPDGTTWGDWQRTVETKNYPNQLSTKLASTPQRYTQIKTVLYSYDNLYTPTVGSYALHYYYDVDPPTNPTVLEAYEDTTKAQEITSNTWYNISEPYFDWPNPGEAGGATDGPLGSNIAGYWVYFGTDSTASPRTAGTFVAQSEFEPTLTTPGTYHLRIQAQDITGNVDGTVYAPFIYRFDNQPPSTPTQITVTPGGFTTTNNFTFDWPAAFDAHSGISKYCYKTGATSGAFANEICQNGRNLSDVSAAYRTGTNVFYVRTLDTAGNYSSSSTTVSYYYSTDPPSPPTNLRAVPPSSPQNLFAFVWDLPSLYSGDPDQLSYCYSINILPSPLNTTCTDERFVSAFKAATQQGTNVLYMVTKDEAGNANWNNYATANFIANTVSPGIPLNLVATDTSDRSANRWSITVTWDAPSFEGNGIDGYVVERSLDGNSFTEIGKTTTRAFVDLNVEPETTYYYRTRAADNVDNRGGPSGTVSQKPKGSYGAPPAVVSEPTASADSSQAQIKWVTNRDATSFVYYGTSPTDLAQSKGSLEPISEHNQIITGLQPSTTYYYRVQSFDNDRSYSISEANSQIYSFRTSESARIYNVSTDSVTLNSGVVSWQTSVPTKTTIEYGPTLSYGMSVSGDATSLSANHLQKISGLSSGTTYHFRIIATTSFGSKLYSDDYTFTTIARPVISNVRFQPQEDDVSTAVRVTWTTNVPTSSTVRYSGSGVNQEITASELTTQHEMLVSDLASSTDYNFLIEGRDQYGNLASSENQKWRSTFDTRPPKISDVSISMSTVQGSSNTRAQLIVAWKTDEPSTSQVFYDKANTKKSTLTKKSPLDTEPTTSHVVIISNLDLADIYNVQVVSRDISGNTVRGAKSAVVTPDKETSLLDNVLIIMQRLFRF